MAADPQRESQGVRPVHPAPPNTPLHLADDRHLLQSMPMVSSRRGKIPASWLVFAFLLLQVLSTILFSHICNLEMPGSVFSLPQPQPNQGSGAPNLTILLWKWPFGARFPIRKCSELLGIPDCHITANRVWYPKADAVIIHHYDVCTSPRYLPQGPRPPSQRWVWFNMEPPIYTRNLHFMDNRFNLTMSYRRDSDIFIPYGWLEVLPRPQKVTIPPKSKLVAWVVSNWKPASLRVQYYQELKKHIQVDVYGYWHLPLSPEKQLDVLSQYKFYLAFENSVHMDYITEKLWKTALLSGTVPVVCGPPRKNYEHYLPPSSFIHIDDFPTAQKLALFLQELDRNSEQYQRYFQWRSWLTPVRHTPWSVHLCKACQYLQTTPIRYQTVSELSKWFLSAGKERCCS